VSLDRVGRLIAAPLFLFAESKRRGTHGTKPHQNCSWSTPDENPTIATEAETTTIIHSKLAPAKELANNNQTSTTIEARTNKTKSEQRWHEQKQ
jgi:hypothetical protein